MHKVTIEAQISRLIPTSEYNKKQKHEENMELMGEVPRGRWGKDCR